MMAHENFALPDQLLKNHLKAPGFIHVDIRCDRLCFWRESSRIFSLYWLTKTKN